MHFPSFHSPPPASFFNLQRYCSLVFLVVVVQLSEIRNVHTARGVIVLNSITYFVWSKGTRQPCCTSGWIASNSYSHLLFRILCDSYVPFYRIDVALVALALCRPYRSRVDGRLLFHEPWSVVGCCLFACWLTYGVYCIVIALLH